MQKGKEKPHHTKSFKERARILFVEKNFTKLEVCDMVGCTVQTLDRYIKEGDWRNQKERAANLPNSTFEIYLNVVNRAHTLSVDGSFDIDNMAKLVTIIEKMQPKTTHYNDFVRLTTDMTAFCMKSEPAMAKELASFFKKYAQVKFAHLYDNEE